MKNTKKILLTLAMILLVGGCGKNDCNCPSDTNGNVSEEQTVVINDYSELYEKTVQSVVMLKVQRKNDRSEVVATGSGVVAFEEGEYAYIYTNAHVVKNLLSDYEVEVVFSNAYGFVSGESEVATLVGKDENEDVAVLRIKKSTKYKLVTIGDSEALQKGDWIYTIGSPLGKFNYTTAGNIANTKVAIDLDSSKTGVITPVYAIMFDASINQGNSGGALFDKEGKLVGITTLRYDDVYGMYGALPINYFGKVAKHLMVNGTKYTRPALSLDLLSVNELGVRRSEYGISSYVTTGAYVKTSLENNVIAQSIITAVNGKTINSTTDFAVEILKYSVGDTITLTLINKDGLNTRTVSVTLHA